MAAGILRASRQNATISGIVDLKGLARLIELSKRQPQPIISEIIVVGGMINITDVGHFGKDYFAQPWLEIMVTVEDWAKNMQYDRVNKVATIDKTVNLF